MKQKIVFTLAAMASILLVHVASADLTMPEGGSYDYTASTASSTPCSAGSTTPCGLQMPGGLLYSDLTANMPAQPELKPGPRLIRVDESSKVAYYVTPEFIKIPMWTEAVFSSYKNKWTDVETVTQEEFDQYWNAEYIKLKGSARVYKIEGRTKRYVPPEVAAGLAINPAWVVEVNKTDFNSYKTGSNLTLDSAPGEVSLVQ